MSNSNYFATIKLHRENKGLFKKTPAIVLFDNRLLHLSADDVKEFEVKPGTLTMTINKRKHLTFKVLSGETMNFVIKESIYDWRFLLKYGLLFFLIVLHLWMLVSEGVGDKINWNIVIVLGALVWGLSQMRYEYFYLEEE